MALRPGTRLGPYEVSAQIGEGGMGAVYRARDTKLNRDVALKVLPDSFASDTGRALRATGNGARWSKWPTSRSRLRTDGTPRKSGLGPVVKLEDYERTLFPALVRQYQRRGYCTVLTGSTQFGRALAEPEEVPQAIKYYEALKRSGRVVYAARQPQPAGRRGRDPRRRHAGGGMARRLWRSARRARRPGGLRRAVNILGVT